MSIPDDDDMNCSDQNDKSIIVALADDEECRWSQELHSIPD